MDWKDATTAPPRKWVLVWDGELFHVAMNDPVNGRDEWCTNAGILDGRVFPTHWCLITPPSEQAGPSTESALAEALEEARIFVVAHQLP